VVRGMVLEGFLVTAVVFADLKMCDSFYIPDELPSMVASISRGALLST
jgi:hypothetical protein